MTNNNPLFEKVASLFRGSDRGVSPIVATLILIALVVVMGGAVATMLFGFGSGTTQTPHAKMTFTYQKASDNVIIRDTGGPKLTQDNTLYLRVKNDNGSVTTVDWSPPPAVAAGDQTNIAAYGGDHISVVWTGANGENTATLASFDVPS